jgi:zinc transporter ZupT
VALLLLSLAALLVGPVVERLVRRAAWTEAMLDGFVLTALVGLILIHVLPHNVEVAGLWAFAAAGLGFVVPLLLESRLHEHGDGSRGLHRWLLVAGFLGYAIHASLDGLALATGHDDHGDAGELLGVAVVLHRIPVGLAIWWLLRPAVGPLGTMAIIGTIAASTIAVMARPVGCSRAWSDPRLASCKRWSPAPCSTSPFTPAATDRGARRRPRPRRSAGSWR